MSRKQLTSKQHTFLQFLAEHVRKQKVWPTYREIVDEFGYRSPNSVTQNLQALAKKGYLTRDQGGYRLVGQRTGIQPGGFPIQGSLTGGTYDVSLKIDEIALRDLFPDLDRTFAVRLDEQDVQGLDMKGNGFLLLQEGEVGDGEVSAVVHEGAVMLCRTYEAESGFCLRPLRGDEVWVDPDERGFKFLGRYAGHIDRYGLVRASGIALPEPAASEGLSGETVTTT